MLFLVEYHNWAVELMYTHLSHQVVQYNRQLSAIIILHYRGKELDVKDRWPCRKDVPVDREFHCSLAALQKVAKIMLLQGGTEEGGTTGCCPSLVFDNRDNTFDGERIAFGNANSDEPDFSNNVGRPQHGGHQPPTMGIFVAYCLYFPTTSIPESRLTAFLQQIVLRLDMRMPLYQHSPSSLVKESNSMDLLICH